MATDTKHCTICASNLEKSTRLSPQDHERVHGDDERACGQCWEAWLSLQIEEKKPDEIECLFCKSFINGDDFVSLARDATVVRYSMKKLLRGVTCMNRCKDSLKTNQDYDRDRDGRVFTCQHCHFQVCFDCDRPEHADESCSEYRERQEATHGAAEARTFKVYKTCPDCKATIKPLKSNCHTQCESCGYRFCSGCMVHWVGEGSAYLLGKEAHLGKCKYRTRDVESTHSLGNRWKQTNAVQQRLGAKAEEKRVRRETRKRVKAEAAIGKGTNGSGVKKSKKRSKRAKARD